MLTVKHGGGSVILRVYLATSETGVFLKVTETEDVFFSTTIPPGEQSQTHTKSILEWISVLD